MKEKIRLMYQKTDQQNIVKWKRKKKKKERKIQKEDQRHVRENERCKFNLSPRRENRKEIIFEVILLKKFSKIDERQNSQISGALKI